MLHPNSYVALFVPLLRSESTLTFTFLHAQNYTVHKLTIATFHRQWPLALFFFCSSFFIFHSRDQLLDRLSTRSKFRYAWCQASAATYITAALFCVVTQRVVVISHWRFGKKNLSRRWVVPKCRGEIWYDMIYLLTAIGLSPGGSSTVHIYRQTTQRTTQFTN